MDIETYLNLKLLLNFEPRLKEKLLRISRRVKLQVKTYPFLKVNQKNLGGLKIPVVAVLVEGGIESFDFVKESVNFGIPVVLCQGTGRAADIMAYAFKHHV